VSTLLFILLFGIIQYGLFFWQLQGGAAAAREGARYSAVGSWSCATLNSEMTSRVPAGGTVTVTRTYIPDPAGTGTASSPKTGDDVKVTVSFNTVAIGGLVPMPNNGVVLSEAQARVETVTSSTGAC
jgi:Flp pilus assembly protein TadG